MCLPLIAPHLIATPRSPIGHHFPRTSSLNVGFKQNATSLTFVQSRRCAVHRLVSHVARFSPNVST
ncbi:hypothetical protein AtNW77_Chr5g0135071 [Arabidopsis thaliana]|uniref:Uncharacterized protein n=4 Tax=Arabidopsis TaxID=3701 RepID=A0A654GA75_ARATH|nr:uncharacterized protein AT5G50361 [Arabidopsis thaliana]KAG7605588.1 hypothetical protein ISN45_At05g045840 [Arabidopsis thaliana x Arabidopsis arenosa]KAG7612513.1 hypothetical protein ISN44_As05g045210 [Arabidopsis suecica]AED95933.1 hypothetical protein AT5G50361 [Arabidopsis thaliana]CAA0408876.1 unnamed protein product [Arabidopsis thaliana]VYS69904.1 unnamed protein product [Arabidopsis thaliana]|eukprot:NP_001119408.1 hypothetical protein AT5G50361 [Arabidopsis thaliana]